MSAGKDEISMTEAALNPQFNNAREAMVGKYDVKAEPLIPIIIEDDAFIKKYSGPVLLGPFVPAVFALINIFFGQNVLATFKGDCVQRIDGKIYINIT